MGWGSPVRKKLSLPKLSLNSIAPIHLHILDANKDLNYRWTCCKFSHVPLRESDCSYLDKRRLTVTMGVEIENVITLDNFDFTMSKFDTDIKPLFGLVDMGR